MDTLTAGIRSQPKFIRLMSISVWHVAIQKLDQIVRKAHLTSKFLPFLGRVFAFTTVFVKLALYLT